MSDDKFTVTGTFLKFDSPDVSGDIFAKDAVMDFKECVPVRIEFDEELENLVGMARIRRLDDCMEADIKFFKDPKVEEFLKNPVYPCIGGYVQMRSGKDNKTITKAQITNIGLSISGNADRSIPPLKVK